MSLHNGLRLLLGAIGLGAVAVGGAGWRRGEVLVLPPPVSRDGAKALSEGGGRRASLALLEIARRETPFRPGHQPPVIRYGTAPPPLVAPATPPVPKPALSLSGILWGADPAAIVEGVPGQEAPVVLRVGERSGPLEVIGIAPDRVRIRGIDTTWTLTVREPWH